MDASPEITSMLSNCMFRLVRAICLFFDNAQTTKAVLRQNLFPIVYILLECLLLPSESSNNYYKLYKQKKHNDMARTCGFKPFQYMICKRYFVGKDFIFLKCL